MEEFLARYGAVGVFLGAAFEGQTAVIIGGMLAKQHLFPLWLNIVSATAGSAAIDHLLFVGGRRFRTSPRVLRMASQPAFAKALTFIERFPISFILVFRFLYGLRLASPVAIGVSQTPTWLFTVMNMVAALVWSAVFTAVGYGAGAALQRLAGHGGAVKLTLLAAGVLAVAGVVVWLVRRRSATAAGDEAIPVRYEANDDHLRAAPHD